ncbi:exportin KapK [Histoplasma capsulatum]|uniref:Exportin KapK n=1 Tax=Ajellomyces capsulatus TaxID=5037 RepID=A0A8A1M1M3_AJECA|nr:exportin KapK [Histoplasma capsulatum]
MRAKLCASSSKRVTPFNSTRPRGSVWYTSPIWTWWTLKTLWRINWPSKWTAPNGRGRTAIRCAGRSAPYPAR